jgi:hypothetical protein
MNSQIVMQSLLLGLGAAGLYKIVRQEPVSEAVVPGIVLGTVILVVRTSGVVARPNAHHGTGNLSAEAVRLLHQIGDHAEANGLYAPARGGGIRIEPVPDQPSIVNQDEV